jgi:hypothetical protein
MRRVSLWVLAVCAASSAAAVVAAGCSSSSATSTVPDAGTDDASDAGGVTTCYVDASLQVFAASDASAAGCASCVNAQCLPQVNACAIDCACINLFSCLADSGVATSGLGSSVAAAVTACAGGSGVALLNDTTIRGLANCLQGTCANACSAVLDGSAGTDAATGDDGPAEDAAVTLDGGASSLDASDGG